MKDLLGGCLLAIGMLIAGATGLCMYMVTGAHWRGLSSVFQYLGGPFLVCRNDRRWRLDNRQRPPAPVLG